MMSNMHFMCVSVHFDWHWFSWNFFLQNHSGRHGNAKFLPHVYKIH